MKKKKMKTTDYLIIIVLIIIICASYIAFTSAKYASKETESDTAYVAKWSFVDGDSSTQLTLKADETLYPNLKSGTIAPGTSGNFDISLDASGSDVGVQYEISIAPEAGKTLPTGLKILLDSSSGVIMYDSNPENMKRTINVTWEWTYGDETNQYNYDENQDTGYNNDEANQTTNLDITIKGKQLQPQKQ